jgi:hypothetical protein
MIFRKTYFIFISICWILLLSVNFLGTPAHAGVTNLVMITGSIPLTTYNISATGIGANNATITWKTNGNANSIVEYGTTTSYGSTSTDDVMVASHVIGLYSLSSHMIYHYRVNATTLEGLSITGADANFTIIYPTGTTVATATAGTTVTGVATKTDGGVQQVSVNKSTIQGTTQVSGNTVTITNPGNGWSSLQYTGTNVIDDGKDISISGIQGVTLQSKPVTADLGGNIGAVSTQIDIALIQLVSSVTIQQTVIQGATASVASAFQLGATSSNLDVKSVAYTVEFQNTGLLNANLGAEGVTLDRGIDHAWVVANAPDGDRNNIRILRFGDDGTKEVLITQYTGSQGSTDYFKARSPHGLSVFGMAAVASTSGGGGGGNNGGSRGGGSGGGSDSSSSGLLGGLLTGQQAAQKSSVPVAPPVYQRLTPPGENAPTTTRSLSVPGLTITTGSAGRQAIRLDTARAEASGATITLQDNIITISQPGFTIIVVTSDTPIKENCVISGTVRSVRLRTAPAYADTSIGTVSIALDTPLAGLPENVAITTTISETANHDIQAAFQSAAQSRNQQIEGIAYRVYIGKSNVVTTGPAIVTLTISPDWVTNHGGTRSIGIAHISDEGTSAILRTNNTGSDNAGNMVFKGTSPQGLSAFGLVSLKNMLCRNDFLTKKNRVKNNRKI